MRKLCCASVGAILGLILAGCAQQPPAVEPAAAVAQLSTGAALLRCRTECVADWRRAQPRAAQLDAAGHWPELAALVITIGYQDDLTLYYLARAAEGLGYPAAAASYYRQSTYISGTSLSCRYESGLCGGAVLPDAALARIDVLENEAARSQPHPLRHSGPRPASAGPRSNPATERKPRPPATPEHEMAPTVAPTPQLQQPAAPAAEQNQPVAPERANAGPEPPPPAPPALGQPALPPPARVDPVAKQYIEPPRAR